VTLASLASAIASFEGFGAKPTNRPTRNNNPGDLTGTGYQGQTGVDAQGFAIFSTPAAGQAALQQYLSGNLAKVGSGSGPYGNLTPNSTLQDFLNIYAGNPDAGYISGVARSVGLAPNAPLAQLQASLGLGGSMSPPPAIVTQPGATTAPDQALNDLIAGAGNGGGGYVGIPPVDSADSTGAGGISTGAVVALSVAGAAVALYLLT